MVILLIIIIAATTGTRECGEKEIYLEDMSCRLCKYSYPDAEKKKCIQEICSDF